MAILRAQVRLPYFSNVPEDVATNRLHFETDDVTPPVDAAEYLTARIEDFYQGVFGATLLSPVVNQSQCSIVWYDMADPTPRVPIAIVPFDPATGVGTGGLPEEVAVVMSFQATPVAGQVQSRRRNRIYLGPLQSGVITMGTASSFPVVSTAFRGLVTAAATSFLLETGDEGLTWIVRSETTGATAPVANGWVDSRPDTQRRRGSSPLGRTLFPNPA